MAGRTVPPEGGLLGAHTQRGGVSSKIPNLVTSYNYRRRGLGLSWGGEKSYNAEKDPDSGGEGSPGSAVQKRALATSSGLLGPTSTMGAAVQEILRLSDVYNTQEEANRATPEVAADPQLEQPQVGAADVNKCRYK